METPFQRCLVLLGLLFALSSTRLNAQEAIGFHITAFTSAERDSIKQHLPAQEGLRVVFACVPAGVLVVSSDGRDASRIQLRSRIVDLLDASLAHDRIGNEELTLEAAETSCANARNQ